MGSVKNSQMDHDRKVQVAIGLCISLGAIEECEIHEGEYIDTLEYMDYAELSKEIIQQNAAAANEFEDMEDMNRCVEEAMHSSGEECGYCAKNRDS